jgi:hypothetical protein
VPLEQAQNPSEIDHASVVIVFDAASRPWR